MNVMTTTGIVLTALVLISWQLFGTKEKLKSWLGFSALTLELLAGSLAISWAANNAAGALTLIFVTGFVGLALAKASIVTALNHACNERNHKVVALSSITLIGVYAVVYLAGAMAGNTDTHNKQLKSTPLLLLDERIKAATNKLDSLAMYSDSGKASQEKEQIILLKNNLKMAQETLSKCPANYISNCVMPFSKKIESYQTELDSLTYLNKHELFKSTEELLSQLNSDKLLLLKDNNVTNFNNGDDELISYLLSTDIKNAPKIKWLLFVLAFDLISLLLRLTGEFSRVNYNKNQNIARFSLLLDCGFTVNEAAYFISKNNNDNPPLLLTDPVINPIKSVVTESVTDYVTPEPLPVNKGAEIEMEEYKKQNLLNKNTGEIIECLHCKKEIIKQCKTHIFCSHNRKKRDDGGNCTDDYHNSKKSNLI